MASAICLRLFVDCVRAAASRTFCTAGTSKAKPNRMSPNTKTSCKAVNANRRVWRGESIIDLLSWYGSVKSLFGNRIAVVRIAQIVPGGRSNFGGERAHGAIAEADDDQVAID